MSALELRIISPDPRLRRRWSDWLAREGFPALLEPGLRSMAPLPAGPCLLFLDWDAEADGSETAIRRLKDGGRPLTLILAAGPAVPVDRVAGSLEAGADDHILPGVPERLFIAKLRAHLRRLAPHREAAGDVLRSPGGGVSLDRAKREAWVRGERGKAVQVPGLTRREFDLLELFLRRPGRVLERRLILETLWQERGDKVSPGTVDKHVESLRRKLGKRGALIRTVYGVGYALREE